MASFVATQSTQSSQRELRHNIRSLATSVQRQGDDLADINNLPQITTVLQRLNTYHDKVEKPREQVEDSNCLMLIANRASEMAKEVAAHRGTQGPRECVARLKRIFSRPARSGSNGVGPFSWLDFSDAVDKFFQPASGVSCILGPMDAEIKTRKAPMRREKRKPVGEARTADELVEQETDKQATDKLAEEIDAVLKQVQSAGFLELVINHSSFSQTVENIFALSFLVRDGRARLSNSEKGLLVQHNETRRKDNPELQDRMQFVVAYDMEDWATWIKYVKPEDCLTPHREVIHHSPTGLGDASGPAVDSSQEEEDEELPSRSKKARRTAR